MRVLIVEDEVRISENIRSLLTKQRFNADVAKNGEEALFQAETEEYDAIILDWMLPDVAGNTLISTLRNKGLTTPIIMLTAKSQVEDKVEAIGSGADDYMTKPFAFPELLVRIKALIRRHTKTPPSPLVTVGDLVINTNTCSVTRANQPIPLSPKEYALLEYLAYHKNQVVSRMELLSHVWGEEIDAFSNTVDVHIRYLRKKIDNFAKNKLIQTVKNKGYMLCPN